MTRPRRSRHLGVKALTAVMALLAAMSYAGNHLPPAHGGGAQAESVVPAVTVQHGAAVTEMGPRGPVTTMPGNPNEQLADRMAAARGWAGRQRTCLDLLWTYESARTWDPAVTNPTPGFHAYGIPQALPGFKMAAAGADWRTSPATQIRWGLGYIRYRYLTPCRAWRFELDHNAY